jgi:dihydroorotase
MIYKNATLSDNSKVDIEVQNNTIVKIAPTIEAVNFTDLKGAYVLPKLTDLSVRLKDATLNATNIKKLAQEAQKGGVGHIVLVPHTTPSIDNEITLEFAQNSIKDIKNVHIDIAINALKEDLSLSNIAILLKKGALTPYMSTIAKNNIAIKVAEYIQMYKTMLFCKAEDNSLKSQGVMYEGDVSSQLGLSGIPELSEVVHVSRMIEIARYYGISILFKAIASPRSLEMIQKAKQEGVKVYAEVSLHHLLYADTQCQGFNTTAKIDPPLVDKASREKLLKALQTNKIDALTVLHQPSSPVNKEIAFYDAAYGSSALADALPLYYTKLVKAGLLTMQELLKLTVYNPATMIQKNPSTVCEGENIENFIIFDITKSYKVENSNSLYNGDEIYGIVSAFEEE